MRRYYRKLALKRIIFCLIYTIFVYLFISYCSDRYSITTSNITNVKSIESSRMKPRIYNEEIKEGNLKYIYKSVPYNVNCLDETQKIINNKYNDNIYGDVYVLKTNSSYLCGTILKIITDEEEMYGIVLEKDEKQLIQDIEILTNIKSDNITKNINYVIERYGN